MKLPGVQYGGVQGVNAPSPQQAVTEYGQKQAILDKATTAANKIAESYRDFKVTQADAAYADEMSNFRREAARLNVLSPGEVAALDLDIDTEGKSEITKAEWYPQLLAKRMEEYRGKHAATIKSPIDRQRWLGEVSRNDNKILEREVEIAASETEAFRTQELVGTFNEAEEKGDFATMQMIIADPTMDDNASSLRVKNQLKAKYEVAEKNQAIEDYEIEVNQIVETGSDADIEKLYGRLTDPEKREKYPGSEREARILTNRVQAEQDRRLRNSAISGAAYDKQRNAIARSAMKDVEAAVKSGMTVKETDMDAVRAKVAGTDYEESFAVYENARGYSAGTYEEKQADMEAVAAQGLDGAEQYSAYVAEDIRVAKGIENQGYTFAVTNALGAEAVIPITSPAAYQARVDQVDYLSTSHYGTEENPADLPIFGTAEIQGIKDMLEDSTPAERLGWASIFHETPEALGEMIDGGAPIMAISISTGDEQTFIDADIGRQRMESGHWKKPSQDEYMQAYRDHAGNITAGVPGTEAAYIETALALYAAAAPEGDEGVFDAEAFSSQLGRVMPVTDINGAKTILPFRTPSDTMQDYVDNFSADQIVAMGGSEYPPERAAAIARDGQWISEGAGKYHVVHGGIKLTDQRGFPMEFVFNEEVAEMSIAKKSAEAAPGRTRVINALETAFVTPAAAVSEPISDALSRGVIEPVGDFIELAGARSRVFNMVNQGIYTFEGISDKDLRLVLPELEGKARAAAERKLK